MAITRYYRFVVTAFFALLSCCPIYADKLNLTATQVNPRSRVDAIAYMGNGVVIAGTRDSRPGYIHKSKDYGATWRQVGNVTGADYITCLSSGKGGLGYLLTGRNVHVWRTTDYGETWHDMGQGITVKCRV